MAHEIGKYAWMKTLPEEVLRQHLTSDMLMVYDACGIDVLISLATHCASIPVYMAPRALARLQRVYIKQASTGNNYKELARSMGLSERFVYDAVAEERAETPDMFENKK